MKILSSREGATVTIRPNAKYAKTGQIEAVHAWATGHQTLVFANREKLEKFCADEGAELIGA